MARASDSNDVIFEARDLKINAVRDDGSELPIVKGCLLYTSDAADD